MAVPEAADPVGQSANAIARQLATDMGEDLLAIMREIFARNAFANGSPTALTKPLNYWASPGSSSMTCCAPANSGR